MTDVVTSQPALGAGSGKIVIEQAQSGNSPETIHVLLVDDERLSRLVVGNLLRKCRYRVTAVATGVEALDALRANPPGTFQLVLTDVMMPDVDGIEVLRHVRQNEALSNIPVVMMSANEQQDTVFECIRAGAEDYLLKPLTKKEVQYIWMHVWRRQHQPAQRQMFPPTGSQSQEEDSHALSQVQSERQQGSTAASASQSAPVRQQASAAAQQQSAQTPAAGNSAAMQQVVQLPANSMTVSTYILTCQPAAQLDRSFRVFCAVLAMLQPLHARGMACGCIRPSQLVLHQNGQVTALPSAAPASAAAEHDAYASPEELSNSGITPASDIFSLGMLFFELLNQVPEDARMRVLSAIRSRNLPAALCQTPSHKIAFLMAMLHPDPAKRPTAAQILGGNLLGLLHGSICPRQSRALLQAQHPSQRLSQYRQQHLSHQQQQQQMQQQLPHQPHALQQPQMGSMSQPHLSAPVKPEAAHAGAGPSAVIARHSSVSDADAALLADFLHIMSKRTTAAVEQSQKQLALLDEDIQEVNGQLLAMLHQAPGQLAHTTSAPEHMGAAASRLELQHPASRKRQRSWENEMSPGPSGVSAGLQTQAAQTDPHQQKKERIAQSWSNVSGAFDELEKVFFQRRQAVPAAPVSPAASDVAESEHMPPGLAGLSDHLAAFSQDLTNFSRYNQLKVTAELNYSDLLTVTDMVCSTAFDRDDEFFATAGVYRRVKIFDFAAVQDNNSSIHYPVLEIPSRSKLSSVCWNSYVKSNIICSDYEGVIQLWDVSQHTETMTFEEHAKRVWSVDFSQTDPTRFVSGSDDGTVRLWSIADENAVATIDSKANVCSVQFSPTDSNLMAFGSANYRVYLYDLRQISAPLAVIGGHTKAVSYVRWVGSNQVISASTDNCLKLWDVAEAAATGGNCQAVKSFSGHTNEKNFVGLSVSRDSYIACGSENNSVYCYHKAVPTPICSHNFAAGGEHEDPSDAHQFVSSVCWSRRGNSMISANSLGNIKILELV